MSERVFAYMFKRLELGHPDTFWIGPTTSGRKFGARNKIDGSIATLVKQRLMNRDYIAKDGGRVCHLLLHLHQNREDADVSRRYQKMDDEMLLYFPIVRDDEFVSKAIARCSETLQTNLDAARRELLRKRNEEERELLLDVSREEEKRNLPGRTRGSLHWRNGCGELGKIITIRERTSARYYVLLYICIQIL